MIVVLLVRQERSITETFGFSTAVKDYGGKGGGHVEGCHTRAATIGHLSFAAPKNHASETLQSDASVMPSHNSTDFSEKAKVKQDDAPERHTTTAPF